MDDAAGYLHAVLMMQADSPLHRGEREDTHEVGPRRAINSARFAPYSDMTHPVSLLLPGPSMGVEWMDCFGSRSPSGKTSRASESKLLIIYR